MARRPEKSSQAASKKHKPTRSEVLASIDLMAEEIIADVRAIAEHQRKLVEDTADADAFFQISERSGNAQATLGMLCWKIRYRGEVAS